MKGIVVNIRWESAERHFLTFSIKYRMYRLVIFHKSVLFLVENIPFGIPKLVDFRK